MVNTVKQLHPVEMSKAAICMEIGSFEPIR